METAIKKAGKKILSRLEDSFSLPGNQRHLPEDGVVEAEGRRLAARLHDKMAECRRREKALGIKFC